VGGGDRGRREEELDELRDAEHEARPGPKARRPK